MSAGVHLESVRKAYDDVVAVLVVLLSAIPACFAQRLSQEPAGIGGAATGR